MTDLFRLRSLPSKRCTLRLVGFLVLSGAALSPAKAPAQDALAGAPTTDASSSLQYVMAVVRAQGLGGALWGSRLTLTNPSLSAASVGRLVVTPHGASAGAQDFSKPFFLDAGESLTLADVVGEPTLGGSFLVRIETTSGAPPAVTEIVTNTQQYGTDPSKKSVFFTYAQAFSDEDLMLPGDTCLINVPQDRAYYVNVRLFGKPQPADTQFPLVRIRGWVGPVETCAFDRTLLHGGVDQIVDMAALSECPATNYTHFTIQQLRGMSLAESSVIYRNLDLAGANDAGIQRAVIRRLVESFSVHLSAPVIERGDILTTSASLRTRVGTTVHALFIGNQTRENYVAGVYPNPNPGISLDTSMSQVASAGAGYVYVPRARATIFDEQGNGFIREVVGASVAETVGVDYIVPAAVANPIIKANIDYFATLLSHGVFSGDNKQYSAAQLKAVLLAYQDGIDTQENMEAKEYRVTKTSIPRFFGAVGAAGSNSFRFYDAFTPNELIRVLSRP